MKRIIFTLIVLLGGMSTYSQELQLHFDPRHGLHSDVAPRNYLTATFQMFKPDKWGSTFMFVDLDFNQSRGNIGLAYMEIARNFNLGKSPIKAHIEYNGGLVLGENTSGFSVPNAYLVGASFVHAFSKDLFFETYLAYKYNAFNKVSNDVQWTGTYTANLCQGKVTLTGFVDVWTENKNRDTGKGGKKVVLLTEPQFWYNYNKHLSVGTEIEISNNFYSHYDNKVYVCPTLAAKWTF
ncbi:hypothetical protein M2132_000660 [Dysgonomonas sp. PH5-45]|uniref:DUF5020 family protein n=1 Tax=unclassified Dysgonomonas TaxID=2630389 RepID=UPI0024765535|nr:MULTISPECIES: DUF5020 family protein [unclassified Dysgonomonas]MDH6354332.1 hypothetical protein [Dysgonomonas sp. PH5-45]MDH6387232.1 hypothetical protein [Dysgonomonas sp. PH5-37]